MGSAFSNVSARNHIQNIVDLTTSIINQNSQSCQVNSSQVQNIIASGDCKITIKNTDFNELIGVDFSCMQDAKINQKVLEDLQVQLDQLAKSVLSGLAFQFGSSIEAENFINNHVQLATEIVNQITQHCGVNSGQAQNVVCTNNSNILITNSTYNQVVKSMFDCAQKGETVTDLEAKISTFITQTATSELKGLSFNGLLIIGVIVLIVFGVIILNKALDWKFLAIGGPIIAIIVYLIIANKKNWWPFKSTFDDKKRPTPPKPTPPKIPPVIQQYLMRQKERAWNRALLGMSQTSLTPEQYRHLKYGDDSIAFQTPYQTKSCKEPVPLPKSTLKLMPIPKAAQIAADARPDPLNRR